MTKEEQIKESYLEYWEQLTFEAKQNAIEKNGFIQQKYLIDSKGCLLDCIEFEWMDTYDSKFGLSIRVFRPKSLQGIEDNNGWIKIESEEDLPNESAYYWIITNSNNIHLTEYEVDFKQFFTKDYAYNDYEITHYQPIEKPKPPIY